MNFKVLQPTTREEERAEVEKWLPGSVLQQCYNELQ